ncbi:hypothetical protein BH10PSE3_BH10PSE3_03490 [soil metagenome]
MTRSGLLGALALLACMAAPGDGFAMPCAAQPADPGQITRTVQSLYAAMAKDEPLEGIVSPAFYAFEGDKRLTGLELSGLIRQIHADGKVLVWNLGPMDIHAGCEIAWAAWENHGAAGDASGTLPVTWYESAGLHRDGSGWVIDFLHAHRIKAAK